MHLFFWVPNDNTKIIESWVASNIPGPLSTVYRSLVYVMWQTVPKLWFTGGAKNCTQGVCVLYKKEKRGVANKILVPFLYFIFFSQGCKKGLQFCAVKQGFRSQANIPETGTIYRHRELRVTQRAHSLYYRLLKGCEAYIAWIVHQILALEFFSSNEHSVCGMNSRSIFLLAFQIPVL